MEKPYKITKLDNEQEIERLDNLLTLLFSNLQEIRHRVSGTTPVAGQLKEGEIIFLDDGSGDRQLYAKIKNTLFRLPKISIDGTLTNNSDNLLPTEKAIKTYADGLHPSVGARAVLTGTQTVTKTTEEIVDFEDTGQYDLGNDFNNATHLFTTPSAGLYLVFSQLWYDNIGDNKIIQARIKYDGNMVASSQIVVDETNQDQPVMVMDIINAAAGKTIGIYTYHNDTDDGTITAVADASYVVIKRLN